MSRNKGEQSLEERLWRQVALLTKQVQAMKAAQIGGADNMKVVPVPIGGYAAGFAVVPPGELVTFGLTIIPGNQILTQHDFLASLFVDVDGGAANLYGGNSNTLTEGQKDLDREEWIDFDESSDITNMRVYKLRVKNRDVDPHTYYVHWRAYLPDTGGATS